MLETLDPIVSGWCSKRQVVGWCEAPLKLVEFWQFTAAENLLHFSFFLSPGARKDYILSADPPCLNSPLL